MLTRLINIIRQESLKQNEGTTGRSRNLAGIRRYVGSHLIKSLDVSRIGNASNDWEGKLSILFDDGSSFECNWASYPCLLGWIQRWRSAYDATLSIQGKPVGVLGYKNPAIAQASVRQ